jgi:uncharacterized membrane protein
VQENVKPCEGTFPHGYIYQKNKERIRMRAFLKTFLQGVVVSAPILLTLYICVRAIVWLDTTMRMGFQQVGLPALPGVGVLAALVAIYLVGLSAKTWVVQSLLNLGEYIVAKIPLVKSLYSAVKDLLQFLSGADAQSRGTPARIHLLDGKIQMLGLVTQRNPGHFLGNADDTRIAVYMPMSYQIGGYTIYVHPDQIEELPELSVEDVLKLSMTAGVGSNHQSRITGDLTSTPSANASARSSELSA